MCMVAVYAAVENEGQLSKERPIEWHEYLELKSEASLKRQKGDKMGQKAWLNPPRLPPRIINDSCSFAFDGRRRILNTTSNAFVLSSDSPAIQNISSEPTCLLNRATCTTVLGDLVRIWIFLSRGKVNER